MTTRYLRAHVGQQYPHLDLFRKQTFGHPVRCERLDFPTITRRAEAPRLLKINQTIADTRLFEPLGGPLHFGQLVAAVRNQKEGISALLLVDDDRAITRKLLGLDLIF